MHGAGVQLAGRYRLDERIGGGGMGEVWRGTDEVLGRTVAVKIMLPALLDEPGFVERFRAEARTMARLKHPGVVNVYDYHSDATTAFLVMEYIDGDPLSRTLNRVGRLTAARTMALIAQAADALEAAHQAGIVHRDVKPGNLMVRANGTLVLTDFGISRSEMTGLTGTGMVLGTASYLSPEQAAGQVATPASDVYALGVVAYQCLAGRRPFEGDNPLEIAMKHVREQPPPLPPDIPPAVREIVMRALAKDPAERWPSAAALAAVARQAAATLGASVVIPPPPAAGPISPATPAPTPIHQPSPPAYQMGQMGQLPLPAPAGHYHAPTPTPGGTVRRDRPSALAVVAVILLAVATVACAGLAGYLVRQVVDGREFGNVLLISNDHPFEGPMTT
ncbi:MAG TPA: serine/threonine-protein kinase [Natronosporangium sp.]|nr:serine/threonine-protein kinase [Natronosporangium sp.]